MMEAVLPRSWKEQFALAAAIREEDILHREKLARFDARQRQITEQQRIATQKREAQTRAAIEAAFAPPARIAEFRVTLDTYDAKTVEALTENQEAMERVRKNLDRMLGNAHVLPDGRRVFKTTDGQQVFDEHGQALQSDTVDPMSIDSRKTNWETYKAERDEERRLAEQRTQLLDYQQRLDGSRDRLDADDVTEAELKRMEEDLRHAMPEAVRAKVEPDKPKAQVAAALSPMPDGMDALMRQTDSALCHRQDHADYNYASRRRP